MICNLYTTKIRDRTNIEGNPLAEGCWKSWKPSMWLTARHVEKHIRRPDLAYLTATRRPLRTHLDVADRENGTPMLHNLRFSSCYGSLQLSMTEWIAANAKFTLPYDGLLLSFGPNMSELDDFGRISWRTNNDDIDETFQPMLLKQHRKKHLFCTHHTSSNSISNDATWEKIVVQLHCTSTGTKLWAEFNTGQMEIIVRGTKDT